MAETASGSPQAQDVTSTGTVDVINTASGAVQAQASTTSGTADLKVGGTTIDFRVSGSPQAFDSTTDGGAVVEETSLIPSWPSGLPQKPLRSSEENPEDNRVRREMEVGPPKIYRRQSGIPTIYNIRMLMDSSQIDSLQSFFENDLEEGVLWFLFPEPRTGVDKRMRFREKFSVEAAQGLHYRVRFELETEPQ